jgi:hypothetical protein
MLADVWDFSYQGLSEPGTDEIKVKASGDDEYRLTFTNTQGIEYTIRYLYANTTGLYFGEDDDMLVFEQTQTVVNATLVPTECLVKKNDYFVVGHNTGSDTGVTRVLKFDSVDTDNSLVQLTDVGSGGEVNAQYTVLNKTTIGDVINVGGYSFDFVLWNGFGSGKEEYRLCVDLDDSGALVGTHNAKVVVNGGGMIDLAANINVATYRANIGAGGVIMNVSTDNNNFDEAPASDEAFLVNLSKTATHEVDLDVASDAAIGLSFNSPEDNDDLNMGMTNYGVLVKEINEDNDPDSLTIVYPESQLLPQAFLVFEKTVTMEGGAGTITVEKPQRIDVGSAVLASQVSDPTAVNVISVGGSCINEVTAEIMGLTYPACGSDSGLSEDEGIVKLYESGDKVAIVVAGWEAEDTTRATRVLADFKTYQDAGQLVGTEVKVTGTSATEFTVTPVTATTAAAETEEEEEEETA